MNRYATLQRNALADGKQCLPLRWEWLTCGEADAFIVRLWRA